MISTQLLIQINEVAQLSILIPLVLLLFRFTKFDLTFKFLSLLLLISALVGFISYHLYIRNENNMPLSHLYTVIEYSLWSAVYHQIFQSVTTKKIILSLIGFFAIFAILNALLWQSIYIHNSYSRSLEGILLVSFSLSWLYKAFGEKHIPRLEKEAFFWINAAVLVYFSGAFLLFIFSDFILASSKRNSIEAWTLHAIFLIFHYLLIGIGIWMKTDIKKESL